MKQLSKYSVAMLLLVLPVAAQLSRGVISGIVQDPSGAVIPGAAVKVTNLATNVQSEITSNNAGVYRASALEPGAYEVEFSKSGFDSKKVSRIEVAAAQEVTLNQTLSIATAATAVQVVDAPPGVELNKTSATMDRVLDNSFIENVAITGNTRNVNMLALLAPTTNRAPGSNEFAANGQRARNNNFLLDGVDNNDLSVTLASNRVIPEGVAEMHTVIQAYSAEFGRNSGAQISVISKSGTNAYHGEVFDYYRGNWMEPVALLNKRAGLNSTPRFVQNQAGGAIGGPIMKNRTFFFSLLEANRRREAADARNSTAATIPTPTGFAALQNLPLGDRQTQAARNAALNGIAFLREVHPLIANYTNLRNITVNGVPIQVGTINMPLANPHDFWYVQDRVDHKLTDNDNLSYRLQLDKRNQPDVVSNLRFGNRFSGAQTIFGQNHALSHTHTFGGRLVNEFRMGYVRRNLDFPENDKVTPYTNISGMFVIGGLNNFPQGRISNTFQFQDTATYLTGKHSFKFGVDIRRNRLYNIAAFDSKGSFGFDNFQDFMNSQPASFVQSINAATFDARQTNQFYFAQDDIKLTRNLTVNLGIRYETSGAPFGFFGATDAQSLSVGVPGPVKRDNNNWAPRAGIAYSPTGTSGLLKALFGDGQTVFRGGYGMGYDVLFYNILTVNASNFPRVVNYDEQNRTTLANVWPTLLRPPSNVRPPFDPLATWVNSPVDTQNPTTHFYSFSIQRQFARSYVFEIAYAGSRSYHGIRQGQTNPGVLTAAQAARVRASGNAADAGSTQSRRVNPAWGPRVTIESTALSYYHSGYLRLDKRVSHGLTAGGNITWSANFADNDESLAVGDITNSSSQLPQDFYNYRNEMARAAFDVPMRLSAFMAYNVPWFGASALNGAVMRHIFKGWSLNGFTDVQSGQPFTIRTGVDTAGTGTAGPHRPSYNPGGRLQLDPVTGDWRTFTTAISGTGIVSTPLASNGLPLASSVAFPVAANNLGRNTFRGPGWVNTNVTFQKTVDITERWKAQIRCDFINAFNHRNFGNPIGMMNSPVFGQNTLDPGGRLAGRTMLASLKVLF